MGNSFSDRFSYFLLIAIPIYNFLAPIILLMRNIPYQPMLYCSHPGDIDLLTGILTEKRSGGSVLGPLGQSLIALQFQRFKQGDRFFFERPDDNTGFTAGIVHFVDNDPAM